jgi:hypothetical protein
MQVAAQHPALQLIQCALHSIRLLQNAGTADVVLDYLAGGFQVTVDVRQALQRIFLGGLFAFHRAVLPSRRPTAGAGWRLDPWSPPEGL